MMSNDTTPMAAMLQQFSTISKGAFAHIEYVGEEKTPKYLGLGIVKKHSVGRVQMRYSYESAVNNHIEKNGGDRSFKALSLPWGQWVEGYENLFITHKGELYLRCYLFANSNMQVDLFSENGEPLTSEQCKAYWEWKNKSRGSARQAAEGLSEEEQVEPFAVNVKNVVAFSCGSVWLGESAAAAV